MLRTRPRARGGSGAVSAPFDPLSGAFFYHDPRIIASVTEVAGEVSAIADQSGNGRTFEQTNAGEKPLYGAGVLINGLRALDYDGTNDFLRNYTSSTIGNGDWTAFAVVQSDITIGDQRIIAGQNGGSVDFGIRTTTGGTQWGAQSGSQASGGTVNTGIHLIIGRRQGTRLDLIVDGTQYTVATASNQSIGNGFRLGQSDGGGGIEKFNGKMGVDGLYASYQSNTWCNQLATYLSGYGFTWSAL